MDNHFEQLQEILSRNKQDCSNFMDIITPKIENAVDEHERLYWHHIFEEEEQRYDRLNELLPKLEKLIENDTNPSTNNLEFVYLLQDISLEKFGLHNFDEHLELALYWYKDSEQGPVLGKMHEVTSADYQQVKQILNDLNQKFNGAASKAGSTPTDDKENIDDSLKALKFTTESSVDTTISENEKNQVVSKKRLTVGSLKK